MANTRAVARQNLPSPRVFKPFRRARRLYKLLIYSGICNLLFYHKCGGGVEGGSIQSLRQIPLLPNLFLRNMFGTEVHLEATALVLIEGRLRESDIFEDANSKATCDNAFCDWLGEEAKKKKNVL